MRQIYLKACVHIYNKNKEKSQMLTIEESWESTEHFKITNKGKESSTYPNDPIELYHIINGK